MMPIRNCTETDRALALVAAGMTRYRAAKATGLALSTVYRAVIRQQQAQPRNYLRENPQRRRRFPEDAE